MADDHRLSSMAETYREKERELQKLKEITILDLEQKNDRLHQLIIAGERKFEQLKDDFEFNLKLIHARDQEIKRLEGVIEKQAKALEQFENECRQYVATIDGLHIKENERIEKIEADRAMNKKILNELKAVIESMQWSTDEELKVKNAEIASLRHDLQSLQRSKDEAIELQRKDLTVAFEQIIEQREDYIKHKETELAHQLGILDQKFERLQNDNLSLKANLREAKLNVEHYLEEVGRLEELNRHLSYQVEDTQRAKDAFEDNLQRQITTLQSDFRRLTDTRNKEKLDYETQIEKLKQEINRERDFRSVLEKRLEDYQMNAASETSTLHDEIISMQKRVNSLDQELAQVRSEKDQALVKLGNKRIELETLLAKNKLLSDEIEHAQERSKRLEQNYHSVELTQQQLQREFESYRNIVEKEQKHSQETAREEITEIRRTSAATIQKLRDDHAEEMAKLRALYDTKLQENSTDVSRLLHAKDDELLNEMKTKEAMINTLRIQLQAREKALNEERTESDALRLRLKAQENQLMNVTQEFKSLQRRSSGGRLNEPNTTGTGDFSIPDIAIDFPSPLQSEDNFHSHNHALLDSPTVPRSAANRYAGIGFGSPPRRTSANGGGSGNAVDSGVASENAMLKKIVAEMRKDIEQLQGQAAPTSSSGKQYQYQPAGESKYNHYDPPRPPPAPSRHDHGGSSPDAILEEKMQEINRLKMEKKKLMDTGNELRSVLLKMQHQDVIETHNALERVREENVDSVYHWIRGAATADEYFSHLGTSSRAGTATDHYHTQDPSHSSHHQHPSSYYSRTGASTPMDASDVSMLSLTSTSQAQHTAGSGNARPPVSGKIVERRRSTSNVPALNSDRSTTSQAQALQRIKVQGQQLKQQQQQPQVSTRKPMNYGTMAKDNQTSE